MKNAILLTLLALLAPAYAAAGGGASAPPPAIEAALAGDPRADTSPAAGGALALAGDPAVCSEMFTLCTTECKADFTGSALGACLRLCRVEQKECLAGH